MVNITVFTCSMCQKDSATTRARRFCPRMCFVGLPASCRVWFSMNPSLYRIHISMSSTLGLLLRWFVNQATALSPSQVVGAVNKTRTDLRCGRLSVQMPWYIRTSWSNFQLEHLLSSAQSETASELLRSACRKSSYAFSPTCSRISVA